MKRTYVIVASVLIMMIFLVGCNTGEAYKFAKPKVVAKPVVSINKTIPKINVTTAQAVVKANVSNITKTNVTLNISKVNVTVPKLNITGNVTKFNATSNYTNISTSGNVSNVSSNVTSNKTNSTR